MLSVSPDPGFVAGKSFAYLFHFKAPFHTFEGKELAIFAEHQDTHERIEVANPKVITYPSWGYEGLERHIVQINIPYAGMWRYIIEVDGEFYADIVLKVREPL
ncbi:hypothetical protein [Alkalihalobacillus pseudalcaliphilus]|uniref:hypothetical protein n=1 Tax=Alkalihalobacillus pseudalcaliphilus TaxID=79884 RepID=UPI00064DBBEB|nr:hypothetical protein [Alkalihalobacillus pseudalcaliphilus]KMK74457.1 hypothetical protein AB990_20635 [Alkalihalobacillus pseudalcaliphilus]